MADREKVLKGLEICTLRPCYCTDCPYKKECCLDSQNLMEDALALLKELEAIMPIITQKEEDFRSELIDIYCCGNCGQELGRYPRKWNYCPICGKPVKWND